MDEPPRRSSIHVVSREPTAIEFLALGGFVLSGGFFAAVLDEGWPWLDRTRWGCLALTGTLLFAALVGRGRVEPEAETTPAEPRWWPQFERDFEAYVRLAAQREQNGDPGRAS